MDNTIIEELEQKNSNVIAKSKDVGYYIKLIIGLFLAIGFGFLPAPEPITQTGMALIGMFLSLIYFYSTLDIVWPNIVVICIYALYAFNIYPDSTQSAGIYEVGWRFMGGSMPFLLLGFLIIGYTLEESGILQRIAMWFITRKVAQKSPWMFTFMFFLATFVITLWLDCSAMSVVMIGILHDIFKRMGYKPGELWPRMMITGTVWIACTAYFATPISHNVAILFVGMISTAAGVDISLFKYMLVGIPVGLIVFILLFLFCKYILRPDVSKFNDFDFSKLNDMKPEKMEIREKFVAVISVILLASLVLPGVLDFIIPGNAFSELLTDLDPAFCVWVAIAIFACIRIDGKALLNITEAFSKISWPVIILVGGIATVALSMSEDTTGITSWASQYVLPIFDGMSPMIAIVVIGILCAVLTNVLNNVAIGVIFGTICVPLTTSLGINPFVLAMTVSLCAQMGYTTPAAFPTIAFATSDKYGDANFVMKNGIVMVGISVIASLVIYPLASFVF